ncbi:MAG: prolipoprotein diacylglyceryl transferase [Prolixibacteraceae bacterium]|nr:prolipoprotein diacylglyceryl transferase [Prolixibacteraceae bacterium]
MGKATQIIWKLLYGFIFVVLIPASLWFWARMTQKLILLPVIESGFVGGALVIAGFILFVWAVYALNYFGKGLPMNAFPPPVYVTKGPYRILHHPIYWGFGMITMGYFIYSGSSSGFWMVTPLTFLGMVALVIGYESIDLKKRFAGQSIRTVFDYPANNSETPELKERLTSLFTVCIILLISNFLVEKLNGAVPPLFGETLLIFSSLGNPYFIILPLAFVVITPFLLRRKDSLRTWWITIMIAMAYATFAALLYPEIGAQYLSVKGSALLVVPLSLLFISIKAQTYTSVFGRIILTIFGVILVLIQLSINKSALLNLIVSLVIFMLSANYLKVWISLKNVAEKIANSWKEWTFGKIRVINHGFYVGVGCFTGLLLAGILVGREYALALLVANVILTVCAALWAQFIEGSDKLKRPFGYYGGMVGTLFGCLAVWAMGVNIWVMIGICSVVMPWIQAIGRLRCLVNGCCHGSKTDNGLIGIRYFHPRSRVCKISGLKGELVHPTQLYSILWLTVIELFLISLWIHSCPYPLIFGLYLILTSLGRFVEEAYRGEVQTPVLKGLHLYQWTAILALIIGIVMTTIQIEPVVIHPGFSLEALWSAFFSGLFVFFGMGVDFPNSNARFSRLV